MTPPPRRGKGRGRGGRGGGGRRLSIDNTVVTPKTRERGTSSKRGGGRGGGGGSSTVSSSSAINSVRPTRTVMTVLKKLVVRNIPPTTSEEEAREMLEGYGISHEVIWRFVPGRNRSNNREPIPARLYLDMKKEPEKIRTLIAALHGQLFYFNCKDKTDVKPLDVEFAPFQKIPREKQRKDAKLGTIGRDPEYVAFLNELSKPKDKLPSAEAVVDMAEGETVEKPVAALVKYLNERKVHSREKGKGKSGGKAIVKNARRQKGKKAGAKQSTKEKSKLPKDRKKKSSGDAAELKSGKQRGRASSKKELTRQEPAEPGMMRIMAPKSVAAVGDSTLPPAGTAPSTDASLERESEKRSSKGGKKNASRGRTNPQKSKDGIDGADGEGTNLKPHARRKGGNGGKKESSSKGERKKRVFAPKDATLQGTLSKS